MRGTSIQSSKSINSINKADAEDPKHFSSQSPKKVPRINSFSPEKKQSTLPQRSEDFYEKLQSYYKRKHDDSIQNIMDKKKGLANRLCRITSQFHRQMETMGKSNSPPKQHMPRVPSLLIKIN
jgi:spermidine/putrescine-binding protein